MHRGSSRTGATSRYHEIVLLLLPRLFIECIYFVMYWISTDVEEVMDGGYKMIFILFRFSKSTSKKKKKNFLIAFQNSYDFDVGQKIPLWLFFFRCCDVTCASCLKAGLFFPPLPFSFLSHQRWQQFPGGDGRRVGRRVLRRPRRHVQRLLQQRHHHHHHRLHHRLQLRQRRRRRRRRRRRGSPPDAALHLLGGGGPPHAHLGHRVSEGETSLLSMDMLEGRKVEFDPSPPPPTHPHPPPPKKKVGQTQFSSSHIFFFATENKETCPCVVYNGREPLSLASTMASLPPLLAPSLLAAAAAAAAATAAAAAAQTASPSASIKGSEHIWEITVPRPSFLRPLFYVCVCARRSRR